MYKTKATITSGVFTNLESRTPCDDSNNDGNTGGDEGQQDTSDTSDNGNTGNTGDNGDSGNNDSSGDGDNDIGICTWYVIAGTCDCGCDDGCSDPVLIIDCEQDNQNIVNDDTFDEFMRTTCGDAPEVCYQPNGDPCPNECNPNGPGCAETSDTNDDEGDTNPEIGVIQDLSVPCFKIDKAMDDPDVANSIADLDGAFTESNERGYGVSKNPDTGDFTTVSVLGGRRNTPLPVGGDIVGAEHIHTDDGYPMFSGDDIANIFLLYFRNDNRNHPDNPVRSDDIFSYLETSVGSFFITVENPGALSALVGTNDLFKDLKKKLNRAYRKSDPNSQSSFVEAFLETVNTILEEKNVSALPLRMFRLNSDNSTLVELTLDENGDVEETPCN